MLRLFAGMTTFLLIWSGAVVQAQTIGYADAIGRLATSCGQDIAKYCSKAHLGNGRVQQCLAQNQAKLSAKCRTTAGEVHKLLTLRAEARRVVVDVCDRDRRRLCQGIQPGDGNLLVCILKAERSVSQSCNQAVVDAGYR